MSQYKRLITNQSGFGLVAVMMELGLVSIMMLAMTTLSTFTAKSHRSMIVNSDIVAYIDRIRHNLAYEANCTASLGGNETDQGISVKDPLNPAVILGAENMTFSGGAWKIQRLRMDSIVSVPGDSSNRLRRGTLTIELKRDTTQVVGGPQLSKAIGDIYYEIGTTPVAQNTLVRCYGSDNTLAAAQSQCQLLGGRWLAQSINGVLCDLPPFSNTSTDDRKPADTGSSTKDTPCDDSEHSPEHDSKHGSDHK